MMFTLEMVYIILTQEGNASAGGILESSGFKIDGDTSTIFFLDDDGAGNVRRYSLSGATRVYANSTQGTINYSTGQVTINSLNISVVENIRGASFNSN